MTGANKELTTALHSEADIADLLAAARGLKIAHYFISQLDYPVIIFQDPLTEKFDDKDIADTQAFLSRHIDEPYVYDGILDPSVALAKANQMHAENLAALAVQQ